MRNLIIFLSLCFFVLFTIFIGTKRFPLPDEKGDGEKKITSPAPTIPSIGRIEVLNGCGVPGAAGKVADFLREKQFDVKNIDIAFSSPVFCGYVLVIRISFFRYCSPPRRGIRIPI